MLDFNEKTATEGVLKSFSSIKNERLKELTQGQKIDSQVIKQFISGLNIPKDDKEVLLSLAPDRYTGNASKIVEIL